MPRSVVRQAGLAGAEERKRLDGWRRCDVSSAMLPRGWYVEVVPGWYRLVSPSGRVFDACVSLAAALREVGKL